MTKREKALVERELDNGALWDGHPEKDSSTLMQFSSLVHRDMIRVVVEPRKKASQDTRRGP